MLVTSRQTHTKLGYIPLLKHILLRNNTSGKLELWTWSRGIALQSITLDGQELEFIREVKRAVRVPDSDYNRKNCPHEIGRIYVDELPLGVDVQELR